MVIEKLSTGKVALHVWKRNFYEICVNGMLKDCFRFLGRNSSSLDVMNLCARHQR